MEKISTICMMREVVHAISELEQQLMEKFNLTLNETMVVCCIGNSTVTASFICENTALAPSHGSKIIRSVERKGLVNRSLGADDKRCMHFTLTAEGKKVLSELKRHPLDVPELLQPLL